MKATGLAVMALVVVGTLVPLGHPALPDVSWPLYLAREVLHGARLTRDFQEMNPPLFVWLAMPAAMLGDLTKGSMWGINTLLLGGVMAAVLWLSDLILKRSSYGPLRPYFLPCLAFVFAVLPLDEFGNREHLALVLSVPYVLAAATRLAGQKPPTSAAVLAGLIGALGFALKPYFLIVWVLVEAVVVEGCGVRALRRAETVVLVLVGASYAAAILLLEPGYIELAMTWAGLYGRYLRNPLWFSMFPDWWSLLPVVATGAVLSLSAYQRVTALHRVLVIAAIGFWLGAVVQRKGFNYHHLAGAGYGFLVIALAAREAGGIGWRKPSALVLQCARAGLAIGTAATLGTLIWHGLDRGRQFLPDPQYSLLQAAVRQQASGQPILVLSSNPAIGWPLTLEAGAKWASRFMSQWQLSALYDHELWQVGGLARFRRFEDRKGVERTFNDAMAEDLVNRRPHLIVVLGTDSTVWGFGGATRLDYLAYFRADPRFDAEFQRYEELAPIGRYRLFRRR